MEMRNIPNHGLPYETRRQMEMRPHVRKPRGRVHHYGLSPLRSRSSMKGRSSLKAVSKGGCLLLFGAILAAPLMTTVFSWGSGGVGVGVLAETCESAGELIPIQVNATNANDLDLATMFDCNGGEFEVNWSGAVNVSSTIFIGSNTTVTIVGSSTDSDSSSEETNSSSSASNREEQQLEELLLTRGLALPHGLAPAAVGVAPACVVDADTDTSISFGPMFSVDGGTLILEDMIVRRGFAAESDSDQDPNGGGVYAVNASVTITRCEFRDHFAKLSGGGIHTADSVLVVSDSRFSDCRAGFQAFAGDDGVDGTGGGINVKRSNVSIDGCLFEGCYASKKGGGINQDVGQISVLNSVFYDNVAGSDNVVGSDNVAQQDATGGGAGLSLKGCNHSFDGLAPCEVSDTVFVNSHVGNKGGAVIIDDDSLSSHVELHRCHFDNSSAGRDIEDDPQGEGGCISVEKGATLVLADCVFRDNHCGKKGGVINLSSGDDWENEPGAVVILRNSTFRNNRAEVEDGGVLFLGEFVNVTVEGDGNEFERNECGTDGGVFAVTTDAMVTVEGGLFHNNSAKNGGVFWSKGNVSVEAGNFTGNKASDDGGVMSASDDSTTTLEGAAFEKNEASRGGVVCVGDLATLLVESGTVTGNVANNEGGAFIVDEGGIIQITGGHFNNNVADFGGFLYKKGEGEASCTGASILQHHSMDGWAIYAVDGAKLVWACDIGNSSALSGSAIYARDSVHVELQDMSLFDNSVARGSVIFLVDSDLMTYQVDFSDSSGSSDLTAVQVDEQSSYIAEDTSFTGFAGEAVVFSEGKLFLDDCDFSGSTASQLVYSKPGSPSVVIRNAVLGDKNYLALAEASSRVGELPNADTLTNAKLTCGGGTEESEEGEEFTSGSDQWPCSTGYDCIDGDLGVYCQCYEQRSTEEKRCVNGNATALTLTLTSDPEETLHPALVEGNLLLSLDDSHQQREAQVASSPSATSDAAVEGSYTSGGSGGLERGETPSGGGGGGGDGVMWRVEALPLTASMTVMDWTVFPSTGLLRPGESITLRVVTSPKADFDGTTNVIFQAIGVGTSPDSTTSTTTTSSSSDDNDDDDDDDDSVKNFNSTESAQQAQGGSTQKSTTTTTTSSSSDSADNNDRSVGNFISTESSHQAAEGGSTTSTSFNITFYHCAAGSFWNTTRFSGTDDVEEEEEEEHSGTCLLCADSLDGDTKTLQGVDCSTRGATLHTLAIREGYWRAALGLTYVRQCPNKDACKGGSEVQSVDEYCNDGYKGVVCSVCSSGYGRSASNQCHMCTTNFRGVMYAVLSVAAFLALAVIALLAVYLVGGGEAVSSTVASTKASVRMLQRRSTRMLLSGSSGSGVGTGFGGGGGRIGVKGATEDGLSCRTVDLERGTRGRNSPTLNGNNGVHGIDNKAGNTHSSAHEMRRKSPEDSTSHTRGFTRGGNARRVSTSEVRPSSSLASETKSRELATTTTTAGTNNDLGVVSNPNSVDAPKRVFNRAYKGPAAQVAPGPIEPNGRLLQSEATNARATTTTASTKIARILAGLPLSKIKIVIVVWQISSAFAEVTNVSFPPIYETFLSIIGVFSLDLGWILSATCLAPEVDFYDKLLIITIGPVTLLGLLAITFHYGASPIRRQRGGTAGNNNSNTLTVITATPRRFFSTTPTEVSVPAMINGRRARLIMAKDCFAPSLSSSPKPKPRTTTTTTTTTVGTSGTAQGQAQSSDIRGLIDTDNQNDPRGKSADLELNAQGNWVFHYSGEGEGEGGAETARISFTLPAAERSVNRSIRNISKAGPGDKTDTEQNQLWELFARHTTMTLIILYLVYSQVSTVVFQTFACEDFPEIGKSYLRADGRIECYTPEHKKYRIYAAVMIFLYPLGIPAAFLYLLASQRRAINPATDVSLSDSRGAEYIMRNKIDRRSRDQTVAPTSFLWNAYYPDRYYYEVLECVRRLLLTGLLVFLPDTSEQVVSGCVFAFISLWVFELQRPHIDALEIQLYRTGSLVIFFTNFLALIIQADLADEHSNSSTVYSLVLVMVHVLFIMSIIWNSWATMKATFNKDDIQGFVLGADIAGEGRADSGTPLSHDKKRENGRKTPSNDEEDCKIEDEEAPSSGWQSIRVISDAPSEMSSSSSSRASSPAVLPRL